MLLDARCHVGRKSVQGGLLAEDLDERVGIHRCDRCGVEVTAESLRQLEWRGERLLHGHLLIEHEADQERQRVGAEEGVGFGVSREVDRCRRGHDSILARLAAADGRGLR